MKNLLRAISVLLFVMIFLPLISEAQTALFEGSQLVIASDSTAGVQLHLAASAPMGHEYRVVSTTSSSSSGNPGSLGIKDQTANAWRLTISPQGNVGIGSTKPGARLELESGDVYVKEIGRGVILQSGASQCWRINVDGSGVLSTTAVPCPVAN